ncbi:MAG: transcriptional regulator [Actinomycetia bacterium]|nr:transcriptional regulator [Actinomycetes bacterium]
MSGVALDVGELGGFLRNRRGRLRPDDVGIVIDPGQRRVPGLRREELAALANVSVDYYIRLEQGRARHVSGDVLDAVARALRLDEDERLHLHDLALPGRMPQRPQRVGRELHQTLAALGGVPAYVVGRRLDVLAWNDLARVLILRGAERNMPRLVFLDPQARDIYPRWESKARETVAHLRLAAGRHPHDTGLAALVAELSQGSADFRRLWADHHVRTRNHGRKDFRHPLVGDLSLDYVSMRTPDDPDLALVIYSAPSGSAAEDALKLLAGVRVL